MIDADGAVTADAKVVSVKTRSTADVENQSTPRQGSHELHPQVTDSPPAHGALEKRPGYAVVG